MPNIISRIIISNTLCNLRQFDKLLHKHFLALTQQCLLLVLIYQQMALLTDRYSVLQELYSHLQSVTVY